MTPTIRHWLGAVLATAIAVLSACSSNDDERRPCPECVYPAGGRVSPPETPPGTVATGGTGTNGGTGGSSETGGTSGNVNASGFGGSVGGAGGNPLVGGTGGDVGFGGTGADSGVGGSGASGGL